MFIRFQVDKHTRVVPFETLSGSSSDEIYFPPLKESRIREADNVPSDFSSTISFTFLTEVSCFTIKTRVLLGFVGNSTKI